MYTLMIVVHDRVNPFYDGWATLEDVRKGLRVPYVRMSRELNGDRAPHVVVEFVGRS